MISVFIFAHQDDEFAVLQRIFNDANAGVRVVCIYLTTGAPRGLANQRRDNESRAVLSSVNVHAADILFAGEVLDVADAELPDKLAPAAAWLEGWFLANPDIKSIYLPAWEGGHHDHDAAHAVGVLTAEKLGLIPKTSQFPLYNSYRCPWPFFRVLAPLPANGRVVSTPIFKKNRLRFLGYCFKYPSQIKTWIGLFPFVAAHYLFSGFESAQSVSVERIYERPHDGPLYYERRKFYQWQKMQLAISQFAEKLKFSMGVSNVEKASSVRRWDAA